MLTPLKWLNSSPYDYGSAHQTKLISDACIRDFILIVLTNRWCLDYHIYGVSQQRCAIWWQMVILSALIPQVEICYIRISPSVHSLVSLRAFHLWCMFHFLTSYCNWLEYQKQMVEMFFFYLELGAAKLWNMHTSQLCYTNVHVTESESLKIKRLSCFILQPPHFSTQQNTLSKGAVSKWKLCTKKITFGPS